MQATEYRAIESHALAHHWDIVGPSGLVDTVRTGESASYAVRLLNAAHASVDPHAPIGCRVLVVFDRGGWD